MKAPKTRPSHPEKGEGTDFFAQRLLTWFAAHRRVLPWRGEQDPYKVWVSEIILQQTRVEQGRDYYRRFLERFPTVESLAAAAEDDVLRVWEGLGYYSRARNMHAAAKQIVAAGAFPQTYDGLRALKGVGAYTAAAVASLAFGLPCAAVDGNVLRVLSRYFGIETPIDTTEGQHYFAALADALLDRDHAGEYNSAIMDFGALQCVPKNPHCNVCPFAESCAALAEDKVESLPRKAKMLARRTRHFAYVYAHFGDGVYLHRRERGDIWQGLYEPLLFEFDHAADFAEVQKAANLPAATRWKALAVGIKHELTHQTLVADMYEAWLTSPLERAGCLLVPERERDAYAVPRLVARLYELL